MKNSLPLKKKIILLCGIAICLFLLWNMKKIQVKPEGKEQKLIENVFQYLKANDSVAEKQVEQLSSSSVKEVQNIILTRQLTNYILQQNKDLVTTGAIHGTKFFVNDKEYAYSGLVPENYNPSKQYALIIHLHGAMSTGDTHIDKWKKIFEGANSDNYIMICPTYPESKWRSKTGEKIVFTLLNKLKDIYNIDENRIFLTGMSMGAGGTYSISRFHPDVFSGIAPVAGATDLFNKGLLLENFIPLPVYIIHGSKDSMVSVEYGRVAYQKLKDLKCDVTYIEHDMVSKMKGGGGHFYPADLLPALLKWFDTKKRKPMPLQLFFRQTKNNHDRIFWISADSLTQDTITIQGEIKNNKIEITAGGMKKIKIFLNEGLVDFTKPVIVSVNNKNVFNKSIKPDVKTLLRNYRKDRDSGMLFTYEMEIQL